MFQQFRNPHFYLVLFLDVLVFTAALPGAYILWFDFVFSEYIKEQVSWLLPGMIMIKLTVFWMLGMYKGMWRYTGLSDMLRLVQAVVLATGLIIAVLFYLTRFEGISRAVLLIDAGLTFIMAGGGRVAIRLAFFHNLYMKELPFQRSKTVRESAHRIIVVGAGDAGEKALRELQENQSLKYQIIGFADDNPEKIGRTIHGVPVLGKVGDLPKLVSDLGVTELFIAIPSATGQQVRTIVKICNETAGWTF